MTSLQIEIQQLRADMTTTLVAPVAFLQIAPPVSVVDLLVSEEPSQPSNEKRPYDDNDPDIVRLHAGLTK